ncbi:crotonobetainyl-CoA:carnitine CoA-transferase CaiB-like acyl-CoA transferase [Thermocatellispora tengchongensis]|uniref:Crotonobetainyl-CoA:carnitine CoA-transferase CaiB-like acyl-CoA transferase n=1 Tax=Thermocatellispora tengchongensis TaxID=1073253 RepID=A0A840PFU3_9ACTN|nr:CoA transferase [Thermocatellispora tengchongensis]MBB5138448.1 crotonobetainyl-CoA:carnitine CoA-transferase CaiB-like acyl-CoA transferase [Thermocatellispora tengchongensis]
MTAKNKRPTPQGPLVGIRVLDIGQLVAGPMIGTFLADWGADVVKIEQPGIGDPIRKLGSHSGAPLWWKVNGRGKRSVALDLRDDGDRDILRRLVKAADILIENFTPGTMERWGLDYASLRDGNPGLIMLRVSGFGQTGPNRNHRAFGRIAQSFSGFSSINGFPDRPPVHPGIPVGDYFGALTGTAAVLAAYVERLRSGQGQEIDLALYEACFRVMELMTTTYDQEARVIGRDGTSNTYVSPVGTWRTADGKWFSLTASTQPVAERLLHTVGGPGLPADPRFATNAARLEHRAELDEILAGWVGRHSAEELKKICDDNDVAYCVEYDIADIFADPHYRARGSIEAVDDPECGPMRMPAVVPRFGRTPGAIRWTGERLDASHDEVLHDPAWGMPPA